MRPSPNARVQVLVAALALSSSACTVGPDFIPPETPVSADWHAKLEDGLSTAETDAHTLASWWTTLNDPQLNRLVERAVTGNLGLAKARSRLREARARRCAAAGGLFPTIGASTSASWSRAGGDGAVAGAGGSSLYSAGLDSAWELDLFGGVRRAVEAAEAEAEASGEDLRDVLVSLLSETALNYIEVRAFQARILAAEASLSAQDETYQMTVWRFRAGLGDQLAVEQARYNLENTRAQIPTLRTGLEESLNAIAILLGVAPGTIHPELEKPEPIPVPPPEIAVGVPANMVRRRPDLRRAEHELAAQTARVGVAMAELYPKLTLSGSIGVDALTPAQMSSGNWTASGGPRLSWAIFDTTLRPNIEIQSALQEQALFAYRSAVLEALREVEDALVTHVEERQRTAALLSATQAAREAATLAEYKYRSGLADFQNVLDAERSFLSFQDQLIRANATVTSTVVRLYKALGGGWIPLDVAVAPSQTP